MDFLTRVPAYVLLNLAVLATAFFAPSILFAGGPENVLVVVNVNSPQSMAVANQFIHLRNIPPQNVVYLDRVPNPNEISCTLSQFKDNILTPVLKQVTERKLDNQIDYIVYSAGFPTAVKIPEHIAILKSKVKDLPKRMYGAMASINSLTYFYQDVMQDRPGYLSMDSNWYSRKLVKNFMQVPFAGEQQKEFANAVSWFESGDLDRAEKSLREIVGNHPAQIASRYYLARLLAKQGETDEAIENLQACVKAGWSYATTIQNQADFETLRDDPRYKIMIKECSNSMFGMLPTRSFSNRYAWSINGSVNGQQAQGKRFVLSTVLAVTTGRGNTLEQALNQLKRSAAADSTHPQGTFFFTKTKDVRSKTRQPQFAVAINELKKMGFRAEVISKSLPVNRKNVLGVTLGKAGPKWAKSRSQLVPGALVDNLTSYGGRMEAHAKQTPCTKFLASGAAGASGTVTEPLAIPNKFPDARLHVHYARGCTLAEAFYQSVKSPFQLLIVGDPICKPWASILEFSVEGFKDGQTLQDNFQLTLSGTDGKDRIKYFDMFLDGRLAARIPPDRPTNVKLDSVSDGYHELRIVAVADHLIATRTSKQFGFQIDRNGDSVDLEISGNGKYQYSRSLPISVKSTKGEAIEIYQNSRLVATVQGNSGNVSIDCSDLGQGPSSLQAIVTDGETKIMSNPVAIEIVAD